MRKSFINKKFELFRQYFPDHKISAKGSIYTVLLEQKRKKDITINSQCVTKGTLAKIGEKRSFTVDSSCRLLLTPTGKLMIVQPMGNRFAPVGMKDLHNATNAGHKTGHTRIYTGKHDHTHEETIKNIAHIFMVGKKYEWLYHYPQLWGLPYFRSFPNLTSAKNYLGYTFISTDQFSHLFSSRAALQRLIEAKTHEQRVAVVQFLDDKRATETLEDLWRLCEELKIPMVDMPLSKIALHNIHDDLAEQLAMKGAEKYSEERVTYRSDIFDYWDRKGLKFEILDSPRKLFMEGQKQSHCLGSYTKSLKNNIFVAFEWENRRYDLMMGLNGKAVQFYGKRNCQPPKELKDLVLGEEHTIEVTKWTEPVAIENEAIYGDWAELPF